MEESIIRQPACVLQCGRLFNEATDSISSIEWWENIKERVLLWRGLDKFMLPLIGRKVPLDNMLIIPVDNTLWNAKKLEQTKEREKKETKKADECQSQSSTSIMFVPQLWPHLPRDCNRV